MVVDCDVCSLDHGLRRHRVRCVLRRLRYHIWLLRWVWLRSVARLWPRVGLLRHCVCLLWWCRIGWLWVRCLVKRWWLWRHRCRGGSGSEQLKLCISSRFCGYGDVRAVQSCVDIDTDLVVVVVVVASAGHMADHPPDMATGKSQLKTSQYCASM
jgi:hypothetical protein